MKRTGASWLVAFGVVAFVSMGCGRAAPRESTYPASQSALPSVVGNQEELRNSANRQNNAEAPSRFNLPSAGSNNNSGNANGNKDSAQDSPPVAPGAAPFSDNKEPSLQSQRETILQLRARNCAEACRALASLERSVTRLCSVEPPKCSEATDLAKRTHAQVRESCPSCPE
jgi:hypothetical protein